MNPYQPPQADVDSPDRPQSSGDLASRGSRLAASMIDWIVAWIPVLPLQLWLDYYNRQIGLGEEALWGIGNFAVWCALHGVLIARGGQTIGKRFLGIRVVTGDGNAVTFARYALLRELPFWIVSFLLMALVDNGPQVMAMPVSMLVFLLIAFGNALLIYRDDRRCGHDHIAGTRVLR